MIDPFHLEAYGKTAVNYNRDIEIFPVVNAMFELIAGKKPTIRPPTWALIWQATASLTMKSARRLPAKEIIRRYFKCLCDQKTGGIVKDDRYKLELLLNQAGVSVGMRAVEQQAHACSDKTGGRPAAAIELPDGTIVTGKTGPLLGAAASALLNALKRLAGIDQELDLVSAHAIEPIQTLKPSISAAATPACTRMKFSSRFPARLLKMPQQLPPCTSCPCSKAAMSIPLLSCPAWTPIP